MYGVVTHSGMMRADCSIINKNHRKNPSFYAGFLALEAKAFRPKEDHKLR